MMLDAYPSKWRSRRFLVCPESVRVCTSRKDQFTHSGSPSLRRVASTLSTHALSLLSEFCPKCVSEIPALGSTALVTSARASSSRARAS